MFDLQEKIDAINKNLSRREEIDKRMTILYNFHIERKLLLTEKDLLDTLGISLTTFLKLKAALKRPETTKEQVRNIQNILQEIHSYQEALPIINDKAIKSGARISKNAMAYILKEEEKEQELVIINVEIDKGDRLGFKELLGEENDNT